MAQVPLSIIVLLPLGEGESSTTFGAGDFDVWHDWFLQERTPRGPCLIGWLAALVSYASRWNGSKALELFRRVLRGFRDLKGGTSVLSPHQCSIFYLEIESERIRLEALPRAVPAFRAHWPIRSSSLTCARTVWPNVPRFSPLEAERFFPGKQCWPIADDCRHGDKIIILKQQLAQWITTVSIKASRDDHQVRLRL